jgi:ribosomal protein L11 methyltransferase
MGWIELRLKIKQEILEQISSYLFAMGCEGIYVRRSDICVYFLHTQWSDEVQGALIAYISKFDTSFSSRSLRVVSFTGQDWNRKWQETFKTIKVGRNVFISPPWDPYKTKEGEIGIIINPQMAFGTGHHESTQLIISCMETYVHPGIEVLDVGTGSGILVFAALKMGAVKVLGIDNDPVAIKNAMENKLLNDADNQSQFIIAEMNQLYNTHYDMILANINRPVILELASVFPKYLKMQGVLILSGILIRDEIQILKDLQDAGFQFIQKQSKKEWLAIVFKLKVTHARSD